MSAGKQHPTVGARVAVLAAQATERVARLESLERQTPSLSGTSNSRLHLARKLTEARAEASSWASVAEFCTGQNPWLDVADNGFAEMTARALNAMAREGAPFGDSHTEDGWSAAVDHLFKAMGLSHLRES